jgi:hypothetical protein
MELRRPSRLSDVLNCPCKTRKLWKNKPLLRDSDAVGKNNNIAHMGVPRPDGGQHQTAPYHYPCLLWREYPFKEDGYADIVNSEYRKMSWNSMDEQHTQMIEPLSRFHEAVIH